jgi:hypothetical protein
MNEDVALMMTFVILQSLTFTCKAKVFKQMNPDLPDIQMSVEFSLLHTLSKVSIITLL